MYNFVYYKLTLLKETRKYVPYVKKIFDIILTTPICNNILNAQKKSMYYIYIYIKQWFGAHYITYILPVCDKKKTTFWRFANIFIDRFFL